jgi:MFS family permease
MISHVHPKAMITLSTVLVGIGIIISSLVTDFITWLVFFGVLWGFGAGISFLTSMTVAWSYILSHKGRMSGIIFCISGLSTSSLNMLCTLLINPHNMKPDIEV